MSKRYWGVFITYICFILSTLYIFTPLMINQFDVPKDSALIYGKMIGSVLAAVVILCLLIPVIKKGVSIDAASLKKSIWWIIIGFFMVIFAQVIVGLINIYLFKQILASVALYQ